jgi:dihydrolipoamide dehydrogenase
MLPSIYASIYLSMHLSICLFMIHRQVLYNKDTEEIVGVHIIGIHAADLIQECANAMAAGTTVREIAMMVRMDRWMDGWMDG